MKESIGLIMILLLVVTICICIISKIDNFEVGERITRERLEMQDNTHTDLTLQDKFKNCPSGANFKEVAEGYHQCCKLDSNKAICEHPTFKKCKENYLNTAKDEDYIKYIGNEGTYDMANKQFQECVNVMSKSFSNYNDVTYENGESNKRYVVKDLHSLNNKDDLQEKCKNMCNLWKNKCKGYIYKDTNCMLLESVNKSASDLPIGDNKIVRGNNLYIKN